jgi:hypothetical protein
MGKETLVGCWEWGGRRRAAEAGGVSDDCSDEGSLVDAVLVHGLRMYVLFLAPGDGTVLHGGLSLVTAGFCLPCSKVLPQLALRSPLQALRPSSCLFVPHGSRP